MELYNLIQGYQKEFALAKVAAAAFLARVYLYIGDYVKARNIGLRK